MSLFSVFSTWWRGVDKGILYTILGLSLLGCFLVLSASISMEIRQGWTPFMFFKKHIVYLILGWSLLVWLSFQPGRRVVAICLVGYGVLLVALLAVLFFGAVIKGGRRWLYLGGFSLQPSEFLKPVLCVLIPWFLFRAPRLWPNLTGTWRYIGAFAILCLPLLFLVSQPDLGMTFLIFLTGMAQLFLGGLPLVWLGVVGMFALGGGGLAFALLPHVRSRIWMFLGNSDPDPFGKEYQSIQAIKAFTRGGFWGTGAGAGRVLDHLPDSHADFIFAVAGEEMGFFFSLGIIGAYAFILTRVFNRYLYFQDPFISLSVSGLAISLVSQAIINIGSALQMIPTKGMTLPFVSYGGSSLLSSGATVGMLLALAAQGRRSHL